MPSGCATRWSAATSASSRGASTSGCTAARPRELDRAAARVEGTLGGMMATARPALYEMMPGLLSCLPAGQDHLGRRRNLDTSSVATMIPFTSSALATGRGLLYGESVHNSLAGGLRPLRLRPGERQQGRLRQERGRQVVRLQGRGAAGAAARGRVLRHRPRGRVRPDLRGGRRADGPPLRRLARPHQPLRPAAGRAGAGPERIPMRAIRSPSACWRCRVCSR